MTRILTLHSQTPEPDLINQAAAEIISGNLVAFPTETVYGLGANALNTQAVSRIFEAKGRPYHDPLIVHLASVNELSNVAIEIPAIAYKLADVFWPGPLTLILQKQQDLPNNITAGLNTVAVRVPSHPVALALLQASGVPIAAPSANRFGHTSPTTAAHVMDDLADRVELILDAGPTTIGVESTVLDITRTPYKILRPGGVTREAIEKLIGSVEIRNMKAKDSVEIKDMAQPSPGLLSKHYTPRAKLILCNGSETEALEKLTKLAQTYIDRLQKVGLLLANEDMQYFKNIPCSHYPLGASKDLEQIARVLYAGMRMLDNEDVEVILTRDFGKHGLGLAIYDRLSRASSQII